ncbi:ribosome 60S biogenesis N-terminal-domain-containing protein [Durotheca rogersii]|uniref:ribosome 60S biogenesis N-terminal-domain-containing protein n=1 Tax=Durotheca rogersii TaxID=419775 RepID=UPI00221EBAF3|nr:ribosome 60S biogenesis N-terminal-domain-containing protein [Durotheca rogersii]KAI5868462.1 ribosome 60S biogenesis N-terminal-domain-containing protein [Durotheca rogersii]
MAKRRSFEGEDSRPLKKSKTVAHAHETPTSEDVRSGRQLRQLLSFEQDLTKARHGLRSFKNLLDGILKDENGVDEKWTILLAYLESVKPAEKDGEAPVYLPDVLETWGLAVQLGNEHVMSDVAAVLTLLIKVISGNVDLVPYALGICRTLLQPQQQEIMAKHLSADKGKDFVISPTLRLLREAVYLDGGTLAPAIFRARNNLFKSLARNIGLRYIGEGVESPARPSVRTNAIRFLLGSLRFLHTEAKRDLISQKDVVAALMRHIREDPPSLVYEILDTLKASVVLDKKLPKDAKIRILNSRSLIRISSLYGYSRASAQSGDVSDSERPSVEESAHAFLLAACTDPDVGIRRSEHAYYPEGVDPNPMSRGPDDGQTVDFGIDSIPWMSKFGDDVPVRNALLAEFIQTLRPWSSTKQNELLVAIFNVVPELIAHYFCHKKSFTFDPKLSATWIGYSALLHSVVQLPIARWFGQTHGYAQVPPPISVLLGNIIPLPLTPKVITRCLSNNSKLASFYAIRLLTLALEKFRRALEMFREAGSSSPESLWEEGARRLVDEFYRRVPDIKDVVNCYRTMGCGDLLQRQAASRLLLLYYEVIPQVSLRAKFDVSPILLATIKVVEDSRGTNQDVVLRSLELENLCGVAKYSPGMRWFARAPDMPHSPFTTLLRLCSEETTVLSNESLADSLYWVTKDHQLVESRARSPGLYPLIAALRGHRITNPTIWVFLDNCVERCARTPVKYLGCIEEELKKAEVPEDVDTTTCPLMMTIAEQIPYFISSSPNEATLDELVQFLTEYLGHSFAAGVSEAFLNASKELFVMGIGNETARERLDTFNGSKHRPGRETGHYKCGAMAIQTLDNQDVGIMAGGFTQQDLEDRLSAPITTTTGNESALSRWPSKTPDELVGEDYVSSLICLLSSAHVSIRKEALVAIAKVSAKIKDSTYENKEQVWLLLMELVESARGAIDDGPLTNMMVAFACKAVEILADPLHCLYEKLNLFLTNGPVWGLDRIPLMQNILQEGPSEDGAYYSEVSWLLGFLLESLQAPADVQLFHKRKVFERLFSLSSNPFMGPSLRTQVLRIVYRATEIEGGSDTLITRFGAVNWLLAQGDAVPDGVERAVCRALVARLWSTCDQTRIATWSKRGVGRLAGQELRVT